MTLAIPVEGDAETLPAPRHQMYVSDVGSPGVYAWTPGNQAEEAKARTVFADRKDKRYLTYATTATGERIMIDKFDPSYAEIFVAPQTVGG